MTRYALLSAALCALCAPAFAGQPALRMGLLESGGPYAGALTAGVEEAVREINAQGGVRGRKLILHVLREARDPWRDGAPKIAELAYGKQLDVMLGPTDRTLSHLAGQIATKLRIPLLALSGGRLLTRVFDPWLFRAIPEDAAQARALLRWAGAAPGPKEAAAVVPEGREGKERLDSLRKACAETGFKLVETLHGWESGPELRHGAVLLWLDPGPARRFLRRHRGALKDDLVLGSLRLSVPGGEAPPVPLTLPSIGWKNLGYDMVRSLAEAGELEGTSPEELRRGLLAGHPIRGRSGDFVFDANGNREGEVPLRPVAAAGRP